MACLFAMTWCVHAAADSERDLQVFGTVAEGWKSNRESFRSFTCRFTWKVGFADSVEAAVDGNIGDATTYEGLWLVDGPLVRYELVCDPKTLEPALARARGSFIPTGKKGGFEVRLPCSTFFYLKDGELRARQSKTIDSLNLFPPGRIDGAGIRITPFALDLMGPDEVSSPAVFLKGVADRRFVGRFEGVVDFRGTPVLSLKLGLENEPLRMGYLVDPGCGYLPRRIWDSNPRTGKKDYDAFILDIKPVGNDRWFPERALVFSGDSTRPGRKCVKELRVLELDVDHRPKPEDFFLDVPKGTQVTIVDSRSLFYMEESERIRADELGKLYQRCSAPKRTQEGRQVASARAASWRRSVGEPRRIFFGGLILAGVVSLAHRRASRGGRE